MVGSKKDCSYEAYLRRLGERIHALRLERGTTYRDIAAGGISDTQWRRYERGGGIKLASLLRVADILGMPPWELIKGVGVSKP